jgi:hypothetical protein
MQRSAALSALIAKGHEYLSSCQDRLRQDFEIHRWPRYDWNQETGQLVFSDSGHAKVIADIQFTGSISTISDTWLWSWANDTIDSRLSQSILEVKEYGRAHSIPQLTQAKWRGHEVDGWEMTAISAYLLKAAGGYRTPDERGFAYMILTAVSWAT